MRKEVNLIKDTKEQILKASFSLFLQKGYKTVTMKEIVEKTGLSKGAVYHYFESKEQIYLEALENAFFTMIDVDYSKFNKKSLYIFYHDYITYLSKAYDDFKKSRNEDGPFDFNCYSLVLDAIRFFPEFKEKMLKTSRQELEIWILTISVARDNKEIASCMRDEQIANIFIQTSSGISMNNMMIGRTENTADMLSELWDDFYNQIAISHHKSIE